MSLRYPVPDDTRAEQARASDPSVSAWVSANAGSGKTHVLAQRVIRLLLSGTDPAQILCLTYTRAAAANMANRVFESLARWSLMPDDALAEAIAAIEHRRPGPDKLRMARRLFARALETPGGLKIQTIHAFCEAVLHRFPLEANIAGHFELLDPQMETALVAEARRALLTQAAAADDPALAEAFAEVLARGGEAGLDGLMSEVVAKRERLRGVIDALAGDTPPFAALFAEFGFAPHETAETVAAACWPLPGFSEADFAALAEAAAATGAAQVENRILPEARRAFAETTATRRLEALAAGFLNQKGEPYGPTTFKKALRERLPDLETRYEKAAEAIRATADRLALYRMLQATRAALTLADRLIERYERLKRARGFLDFDDLIARTVRLLSRADVGPWVQYKLDRGIEHILLDEAQDTSPDQWRVVRRLAEEFFAGLGARDHVRRTIFAVGDEKQSIYSFQGAAPAAFAETGAAFAEAVPAAGGAFAQVRLQRSFRSTEDVLAAVDLVFSRAEVRKGLTRYDDPVDHKAIRRGAPGYVELWSMLRPETVEEPDDWTLPVDHASAPAVRLAETIAATIAGWLADGETIEGTGARLTPGDVMVLVRKRDRFVHALSRSLKNRGVAVAGADRLRLTQHIAVKDLIALGRFLVQPEDDLALAAVLRSPLFDVSEAALFALCWPRADGGSLFAALNATAQDDAALAPVAAMLERWRRQAAVRPVFELYAGILAGAGGHPPMRGRFVARLGHEANDILDEFLGFCLACERSGLPGLEAFLADVETAAPEIKREMDQTRDEVRIMTVHAAKGLEAPVVFLVDPGSAPMSDSHLPRLIPFTPQGGGWPGDGVLWRAGKDVANTASRALEAEARAKGEEEYRRLLYVGMTRAEDRLIVCGYSGTRGPAAGCWHAIVTGALEGSEAVERRDAPEACRPVLRYRVTPQVAAAGPAEAAPPQAP
ncbi:double-strand break repair helicase AddA, partial [Aquibium sp. A9E412]|uniref:double-strand break repair helicase AddA n=1 Tax=Aquibium sp. A9E412 TaxID=2976767 RepID=UPI0025B08BDA